jgi:hypothetical protein
VSELVLAAIGIAQPLALRPQGGLGLGEVDQMISYLVLPAPRSDRGSQSTDQRRHPNRPLQDGDVAEQLHCLSRH